MAKKKRGAKTWDGLPVPKKNKRTTERRFRALQDFEPKGIEGALYAEGMSYTVRVGETWDQLAKFAPKWEKAGLIEWLDDEDGNPVAALGATAAGAGTVS